jgi:hypothetical protein
MATQHSTYSLLKIRGCGAVVSKQRWPWQHNGARTSCWRSKEAVRLSMSRDGHGNMMEHIRAVEDQRMQWSASRYGYSNRTKHTHPVEDQRMW